MRSIDFPPKWLLSSPFTFERCEPRCRPNAMKEKPSQNEIVQKSNDRFEPYVRTSYFSRALVAWL